MPKLKTTVGLAAGIFDPRGKLLLRRRFEHDSITGLDYDAGCWELPITAAREADSELVPYNYLSRELMRGLQDELKIKTWIDSMPAFYPVMFKGPQGYDLFMVTPMQISDLDIFDLPEKIIFVTPKELHKLAVEYEPVKKDWECKIIQDGKGLLSGIGKRQYYMAMKAFEVGSSNKKYRERARYMLEKAHQGIFFT